MDKLPDSYYLADNERLEAKVHQLEDENRKLRQTIEYYESSIGRYKTDMRELEDIAGKRLRKIIELTHKDK